MTLNKWAELVNEKLELLLQFDVEGSHGKLTEIEKIEEIESILKDLK